VRAAHHVEQHGQQLGRLLARPAQQVEQVQIAQDTVALRHVPAEGIAAALLAADEAVVLHHCGRNVLEAHARVYDGHAVPFAELVEHGGRAERLDDGPALPAHLQQIHREQRVHPQLVHERAVLVAHAAAVRVAVQDADDIRAQLARLRQPGVHVRGNRLRPLHLREDGIALGMVFDDARLAAAHEA